MTYNDKNDAFIRDINKLRNLSSRKVVYSLLRKYLDDPFEDDICNDSGLDGDIICGLYDIIQSLAMYISENGKKEYGVAIGFSDEAVSKFISEEIAYLFIENNIKVYIFYKGCPALELAFMVRFFQCIAGVYVENGLNVTSCIEYKIFNNSSKGFLKISDYDVLRKMDMYICENNKKNTVKNSLYHQIDESMDSFYIEELHKQIREDDSMQAMKELVNWFIYNEHLKNIK